MQLVSSSTSPSTINISINMLSVKLTKQFPTKRYLPIILHHPITAVAIISSISGSRNSRFSILWTKRACADVHQHSRFEPPCCMSTSAKFSANPCTSCRSNSSCPCTTDHPASFWAPGTGGFVCGSWQTRNHGGCSCPWIRNRRHRCSRPDDPKQVRGASSLRLLAWIDRWSRRTGSHRLWPGCQSAW